MTEILTEVGKAAALLSGFQHERMRDAAFASNIPTPWSGIVAGYLNKYEGAGDPYHPWSAADWDKFRGNRKLPVYVQSHPGSAAAGEDEAIDVLRMLYDLHVPLGSRTALDLETAIAPAYVTAYGAVMSYYGYRVWPYGSASTIFHNPPLDGYWVADYIAGGQPFMYDHPDVRSTQYTDNPPASRFDSSTVHNWIYADLRHWWHN